MNSGMAEHLGEKEQLRKKIGARRRALSAMDRRAFSSAILTRLKTQPDFQTASGVHCFVSLPDEVETQAIFETCWKANKRTFIPYQIPAENRLGWCERRPSDHLEAGPFGVSEPPRDRIGPENPAGIDLVLAPGLAFDRTGGRLGYGKGYYDRFLNELGFPRPDPGIKRVRPIVVLGLAFSLQIVDRIPREAWDIPLSGWITEREIWMKDHTTHSD